jgi:hypothetical protein
MERKRLFAAALTPTSAPAPQAKDGENTQQQLAEGQKRGRHT